MSDEFYGSDDEDFDLEEEDEEFDCGIMYDGRTHKLLGCGKVGSEECDFECPHRDEMYRSLAAQSGWETRRNSGVADEKARKKS